MKMQLKITMKYHYNTTRMGNTLKMDNAKCFNACEAIETLMHH